MSILSCWSDLLNGQFTPGQNDHGKDDHEASCDTQERYPFIKDPRGENQGYDGFDRGEGCRIRRPNTVKASQEGHDSQNR